MGKTAYWLEKIVYLSIGLIATIFFLTIFKVWSTEQNQYFLFVGDLQSAGIVIIVTLAIGFVLEKLWKWEVRSIFFKPRRR